MPPERVPLNDVVSAPAFVKFVFVKSTFAMTAPSRDFPAREILGPAMNDTRLVFVTNLYPCGKIVDSSNVTLLDVLFVINVPLMSTFLKLVPSNTAPRRFMSLKSTFGPII